jgi:DNA-binding NtrC family response regulator
MPDQGTPTKASSQATVLVVDDDPSIRLVCARTLREEGFTVLEAEGSSEALRVGVEHKGAIDLLVTDMHLPPPDFQVQGLLTAYPRVHGNSLIDLFLGRRKNCRVVLMSSLSSQALADHRVDKAKYPFLQKPFSTDDLTALVRHVLAGPPPDPPKPTEPSANKEVRWVG